MLNNRTPPSDRIIRLENYQRQLLILEWKNEAPQRTFSIDALDVPAAVKSFWILDFVLPPR